MVSWGWGRGDIRFSGGVDRANNPDVSEFPDDVMPGLLSLSTLEVFRWRCWDIGDKERVKKAKIVHYQIAGVFIWALRLKICYKIMHYFTILILPIVDLCVEWILKFQMSHLNSNKVAMHAKLKEVYCVIVLSNSFKIKSQRYIRSFTVKNVNECVFNLFCFCPFTPEYTHRHHYLI